MPTILYLDGSKNRVTFGVKEFGFDESKHPRDPKGSGTGGHFKGKGKAPDNENKYGPGRSFMSQAIQDLVSETAQQLGFDPKKVYYSDVVVGSELGQTIAKYDPQTQSIEVFRGFTEVGPYSLRGVLAHEIAHSKTYGNSGVFPNMNPEIVTNIKSIVGEDRWNDVAWNATYEWMPVSDYSEHIKTKTNLGGNRYVHESIAEVARLKVTSMDKYENIDPRWKKLYQSTLGELSEFESADPVIIWLTNDFEPTDEAHAAMGKVIDGDRVYFVLPGSGARELHMGPGNHPSGSSQDVHGNGEGGEEKTPDAEELKPLKMDELENTIANQEYETAAMFASTGDFMFMKDGDDKSVNFTDEELERMEGNILTHNHPSNTTFSIDDYELFFHTKMGEIRAVGKDYVYVLKAPIGYDYSKGDRFKDSIGMFQSIVRMRTKTDDWGLENHLVSADWAKSIGLEYYREKR